MDRYKLSKMTSAYKYTLFAYDSWQTDSLLLTQSELSNTIDMLIRTSEISALEAVLHSFMAAWEHLGQLLASDENAGPRQKGALKGAFSRVVNKIVEALLRNGVLLNCTPKEIGGTIMECIDALVADVQNNRHRSVMETLIKLTRLTEFSPRLRIETIERYVHMLTRPGDFPDTTIPAPATDTVSKMIMAYLDPQRVVVAEQSTVKRFPDELDKLQPEFGKQLLAVYKLAGAFDKSSIRHFSYCTAILHRANVWAARPLVGKWNQKDPENVNGEESEKLPGLPSCENLRALGAMNMPDGQEDGVSRLRNSPPTNLSSAKIFGHSPELFEMMFQASITKGKRTRASEEAPLPSTE
jgi:hypothetical protein